MAVRFYFDNDTHGAVVKGLRRRGVDVLTCHEDGHRSGTDSFLLSRAALLDRVFYTHDDDHLRDAAERLGRGDRFAGIVFVHQRQLSIGEQIDELELIAKATDPSDHRDRVTFLSVG